MTYKIIILVTIDCLRYDYLKEILKIIPNKWSKIVFQNHYTNAPYTWASFASIFTSTPPFLMGSFSLKKRLSFTEIMSNKGYITIGINGGNPYLSSDEYHAMFDVYIDLFNLNSNINKHIGKGATIRRLSKEITALSKAISNKFSLTVDSFLEATYLSALNTMSRGKYPFIDAYQVTHVIIEALNSAIKSAGKRKNVFIWAHFMDLHFPYSSYVRVKKGLVSTSKGIWDYVKYETMGFVPFRLIDYSRKMYKLSFEYLLSSLKMLFKFIDEISNDYEAYVIITSDHGEEFGEHGSLGHEGLRLPGVRLPHLYEELVHVPLIIASPNSTSKTMFVKNILTSHLDLAPTILALSGAKSPGISLFLGCPLINQSYLEQNTRVYIESEPVLLPNRRVKTRNLLTFALREGRYKYIITLLGEELYNLSRDPKERDNLAMAELDVLCSFRRKLAKYLAFKKEFELRYKIKLLMQKKLIRKTSHVR